MKRKNQGILILSMLAVIAPLTMGAPAFADDTTKSPDGHFEFHLDPWLSLHHVAFHYVRQVESDLKLRGRVRLEEEDWEALTTEMHDACAPLVPAYRPYIEGSLLFDAGTRGLAKMLVNGPDAVTADTAVRDALKSCMPAYQEFLWPRHRAASETLLQSLIAQLRTHESAMALEMAGAFDAAWPEAPIRADIVPYANWAGAYTDNGPDHITLSNNDQYLTNGYAFEILFHETGHTTTFGQSLLAATGNALEAAGIENDRVWHYVLFFVVGRITGDVMKQPDYIPYSRAVGLTESTSAAIYYKALAETWNEGGSFQTRVTRAMQWAAEQKQ